ncbi:hypothetical protein AJ87_12330 [Rhizobium yanglingense]|nr:hypothetical protein AJ87_12330 [Rhizobium yanglingense]
MPCLDLRHIQDIVDDVEQVLAAVMDVAGIFVVFREPSGPNIWFCRISEKPRMALSGVRSSCDMLARNSDFALFAASARSFSAW